MAYTPEVLSNVPVRQPRIGLGASRRLAAIDRRNLARIANVHGEGLVQGEKIHELNTLAREAVTGYTFLRKWSDHLAGADPILHDELRFFTDATRLAVGEVIADTVDTYSREARGY